MAANAALERFSLDREKVAVLTSMGTCPRTADALSAEAHVGRARMGIILASLRESGYARQDPESGQWSASPSGVTVIGCAHLAETAVASEAETDRQLRTALQRLITALEDGGCSRESGSSGN